MSDSSKTATAQQLVAAAASARLSAMQQMAGAMDASMLGNLLGGSGGYSAQNAIAPAPATVQAAPSFAVEKIENGFIVRVQKAPWQPELRFHAEDLKAVGERVTAMLVKFFLEGQ